MQLTRNDAFVNLAVNALDFLNLGSVLCRKCELKVRSRDDILERMRLALSPMSMLPFTIT